MYKIYFTQKQKNQVCTYVDSKLAMEVFANVPIPNERILTYK